MENELIVRANDESLVDISNLDEHPGIKAFSEHANKVRQEAKSSPTPEQFIEWKDMGNVSYPYPNTAYMYQEFNRLYPLHKFTVIKVEYLPTLLSVQVIVELTDLKTGTTEIGVGSARVQIKKTSREDLEAGRKVLTPFDIVDYDKSVKSARTQAKKDAIKEFDVCADIYDRIVVSKEIHDQWKKEYDRIVDKYIVDPTTKAKFNQRWNNEPYKKRFKLVQQIREHFNEPDTPDETNENE